MDMTLPRMHGLELLPEIRKNPDLAHSPVIVLSGSDNPDAVRNAYHSGACAYIMKRPEFADMKDVLTRIFDFWLGANVLLQQ